MAQASSPSLGSSDATYGDTPSVNSGSIDAVLHHDPAGRQSPRAAIATFASAQRRQHARAMRGRCVPLLRRLSTSKIVWTSIVVVGLLYLSAQSGWYGFDATALRSTRVAQTMLGPDSTWSLQLHPASHPAIHYVGRWTATPNRLGKDGTFSGVYFDIKVNGTRSLFLSLRNGPVRPELSETAASVLSPAEPATEPARLSYHIPSLSGSRAPPVSLVARVDHEEHILLPNATSLISVRSGDLDPNVPHHVRVTAPMLDDGGSGVVQLEGVWLDKGGELLGVDGSTPAEGMGSQKAGRETQNEGVRIDRSGWRGVLAGALQRHASSMLREPDVRSIWDARVAHDGRRHTLLVVTDAHVSGIAGPVSLDNATDDAHNLLSGVMGWASFVGEMFGADHSLLGLDGMCLVQHCIGGAGEPAGIGDLFFRSGPPGTVLFERPWTFRERAPSAMILNLGASDFRSAQTHAADYSQTAWELFERFEDAYVKFVKAIRQLGTLSGRGRAGRAGLASEPAPHGRGYGDMPIFLMRPLRGEFEHASQGAVNRLRADGETSVFWLDTSGWVNTQDTESEHRNFDLDHSAVPPRWRLTERGNRRVAIYLHLHVCRYLALDPDECPFLPPEVYEGGVFDPVSAVFEQQWEDAKQGKLKALFRIEQGL